MTVPVRVVVDVLEHRVVVVPGRQIVDVVTHRAVVVRL